MGGKQRFEKLCDENWPCKDVESQDFSLPCPAGWSHDGAGDCAAPDSYSGFCLRSYNFRDHSQKLRRRWSSICNAPWPTRNALYSTESKAGATSPLGPPPLAINIIS